MKKDEIIKTLEEAGIEHDPSALKDELAALLPGDEAKPKEPPFEVVKRLAEAGEVYKPGDTIHLTKKRAESLGDLVKPASE